MDDKKYLAKISGLVPYLVGVAKAWLDDEGSIIVDMNRSQMEDMGQDSMGDAFGDYSDWSKAMKYPEKKAAMGKQDKFINLNFTEEFHDGMDYKMSGSKLTIISKDDKTEILTDMFGKDIFGINDENFSEITDDLAIHIANKLTSYFT